MKLTILTTAVFAVIAAPSLSIVACNGAKSAKDVAKDVISDVARAVQMADFVCARIVRSPIKDDAAYQIGQRCVKGYSLARISLIGAEQVADAWQPDAPKNLTCVGAKALEGLAAIVGAIREAGVDLPQEVSRGVDGARLLATLSEGVACNGK